MFISSTFLIGFEDLVQNLGGSPSELLSKAQLNFSSKRTVPEFISMKRFVDLLNYASDGLRANDFALRLAASQPLSIIAPMLPLFRKCEHIHEVGTLWSENFHLLINGANVSFEINRDYSRLYYDCEDESIANDPLYQDYFLATTLRACSLITGGRFPLRAVQYTRNASQEQELARTRYFGCPVASGSERLGLTFSAHSLSKPVDILSDEASIARMTVNEEESSFIERVNDHILITIEQGDCSLEAVSEAMNFSPRSFQRKLASYGTSFRELSQNAKLTQAIRYLRYTNVSMTEISSLLGYSDRSSFSRSCYRWMGIYPDHFRKALTLDEDPS